ncbi:F-box protein CPR1-like [Silene latifolia]|uniref:F-box protein CPR1-like n=1 Tax=Silene latifolia TaxID=37657 RepID=UPI003D784875
MVASCESYLLIACGYSDLEGLILLNPTTRIYRVLPKLYVPTHHNYAQYGMCHCSHDFKVVRFVQYRRGLHDVLVTEVIVYSLNTNLWKLIECKPTTPESCDTPVLVQNHLLVMTFEDCYGRLTRIGCFDIKAERWSNDVLLSDILLCEIESNPTPQWSADRNQYHLGVLDGCLRFSCYDVKNSTYSVWVMKEYGVKESWVKLMSLSKSVYHPIAYRKGSLDELLCIPNSSGKYFWYNIRDKQFIESGIDGDGLDTSDDFSFAYICKESLLNFSGGLLIRSISGEREVDDYYYRYDDGYFYEEGDWFHFK